MVISSITVDPVEHYLFFSVGCTKAQYSFIHDALEEFITCGDTSIAVTNMRISICNLEVVTAGKSGYANQLEVIHRFK